MVSRNSWETSNGSLRSWEIFCREEAREAASAFLDRVRRYKSRNVGAREVHDSTFTNEFSAAFLEESSVLMASGSNNSSTEMSHSNGYTNVLTRSVPSPARITHEGTAATLKGTTSSSHSSIKGGKTWWSNLFKWPKSKRDRRTGNLSSLSSSSGGASSRIVLKEGGVLQLLDSGVSLSWSQCKLVLLDVQGNHQVEVFCPPKSANPKMSLFCFLIEDVRSTTSMETPDSTSCFVIKTQNHGEYVFDAGKEDLKQQWIDSILSYSNKRIHSNGHPPRSRVPNDRLRNVSIGELQSNYVVHQSPGSLSSHPPPPPRQQHPPQLPGGDGGGLTSSEVNSPSHVISSSLNLGVGHSDSEESIMVDMSSFLRNHPYRSPNRQQRSQSMFVSSHMGIGSNGMQVPSHPLHTQLSPSHPSPTSQQPPVQFPYSSPTSSPPHTVTPPPLPKRDINQQRIPSVSNHSSVLNSAPLTHPTPHSPTTLTHLTPHSPTTLTHLTPHSPTPISPPPVPKPTKAGERVPKRQFSQPFLPSNETTTTTTDILTSNEHDLPTPGILETCSQSSSTSALHPVSLAAVHRSMAKGRRGSFSSVSKDTPQGVAASLVSYHKSPGRHLRKISAPVLAPEDVANLQLENGFRHNRTSGERRTRYASDNVLNNGAAAASLDSSPRDVEQVLESDRELDEEEASSLQDDPADYSSITTCTRYPLLTRTATSNSSTATPTNDEATSHRLTMNFPYSSNSSSNGGYYHQASPSSQRRVTTHTHGNVYVPSHPVSGGDSPQQIDNMLFELSRASQGGGTGERGSGSESGSHFQLSQTNRGEGLQSQASLHTNPSTRTNSSSDETDSNSNSNAGGGGGSVLSSSTNPIFVETTESQSQHQQQSVVMHTQHPYEYWATNEQDVTNLRVLSNYPWFHGMISRNNASQLVLAGGDSGTGQYLVRQSESREGDFVLTFNYHDRAKHLRMTLDDSGCNIQHLWFDDVPSMLDYFKTNSIPLESFWLNDDVKLTTFISRQASDSFRTTTVIHTDRLNRVPPRRSRSLHIGMSHSVAASNSSPNTPISTDPIEGESSASSSNSHSTNSLPHSTRNSTGWRQLFRSQRSSSAGNVTRVQRRHSTNAGSMLSTTARSSTASRGRNSENTYILRHY